MRNRLRQLLAQNATTGRALNAVRNDAGVEIMVYDVIDPWFGVSAAAFQKELAAAGDAPVTVRLNSPGGDVFEGRAIASLIAQRAAPVRCVVDGLAASAASTIAVAGKELVMAAGSFLMVHQSWSMAMDNAPGLRALADLLDKVDLQIAGDYARKAGCSLDQAMAWMRAETWFTADEAVAANLANQVLAADATLQPFNLAAFDRAPSALLDRIAALQRPAQPAEPDLEAMRAAAERRLRLFDHLAA